MQQESPKFKKLKGKFDTYHQKALTQLKENHLKPFVKAKSAAVNVAGGFAIATSLAGTTTGGVTLPMMLTEQIQEQNNHANRLKTDQRVFNRSIQLLKSDPNSLNSADEIKVQKALSDYYGVTLKVNLDGNRLNDVWGYFGQEQHLYRWSGDSLEQHNLQKYGIAPATGAFGYFDNAEQEKYYIAAPIHLLPNWNTNWPTLKPWYKFRKVLVYNPKNDKAIVAVIGDAGPAKFTGKNFGGSPEVMNYLEMYDGAQKSRAVVLFVDETNKKVELGPITPNNLQIASLTN